MHSYAQTNIQLFNQLHQAGYSHSELRGISNAYKLAMQLFTARFRPSGKTFIAHLVGTASVLTQLRVSYKLIIAGLLHAAYSQGDFGTGQTGIPEAKRKKVIQVVGQDVEEYVAKYTALKWDTELIPVIHKQIDTLDGIGRDVLLMRIANELEERLDLGILYCGDSKYRRYSEHDHHLLIEMAKGLGYPTLATEFDAAFGELAVAELSTEIFNPTEREYSTLVTPNSCQRKLSVFLYQVIRQRVHQWNFFATHLWRSDCARAARLSNHSSQAHSGN